MANTPEEKLPPPSRRKDRKCNECPTMIRRDNKSGLCVQCVKKSNSFRRAASGAAHRRYEDPEQRKRTGAAVKRANQLDPTIRVRKSQIMKEIAATPEWKERNAQQCRDRRLWEIGVAARTPESDARAGRTFSQRHGIASWCPLEYVEQARELRKAGVSVEETKRMIAEQQEADLERYRRKMGSRWGGDGE